MGEGERTKNPENAKDLETWVGGEKKKKNKNTNMYYLL
jgi:hypothetical protein